MQAVSTLRPIIDHSFDNVPTGQPSISEFISRNYALIKADVAAHPSTGNDFGLVVYNGKGMQDGSYIISLGEAVLPAGITFSSPSAKAKIVIGENGKYGDLKTKWGMTSEEYLTLIAFVQNDAEDVNKGISMRVARLRIKENLAEDTVVTAVNAAAAFDIEGDATPVFALSDGELTIGISTDASSIFYNNQYHIVTRKVNGAFIHSTCVMKGLLTSQSTSDLVLPTYPVGTQMFLNGGEI